MNTDLGIDVDMSNIKYNVLRFDFSNPPMFDDSCNYHFVTKSDIGETEKILRKAFDDHNKTAKRHVDHEDYGRQYIGAKAPNGDILIYVNCFVEPARHEVKWLVRVRVHDGWDGYFEGMFNLTTGEIIYFGHHGSA